MHGALGSEWTLRIPLLLTRPPPKPHGLPVRAQGQFRPIQLRQKDLSLKDDLPLIHKAVEADILLPTQIADNLRKYAKDDPFLDASKKQQYGPNSHL